MVYSARVSACGPDFPNWLLSGGDAALLHAPFATFVAELARLRIESVSRTSMSNNIAEDHGTLSAETADLKAALFARGSSSVETSQILQQYLAFRKALGTTNILSGTPLPSALPTEFSVYLRGAQAWSGEDREGARAAWKELLELPKEQRLYKSTWATYMLGRATSTNEWEEAISRYQKVRSLAAEGFADTLDLAEASLGWEARVRLDRQEFDQAIHLYLKQYAADRTGSAVQSLQETARQALAHASPDQLRVLVRDENCRRVIGAWSVSRQPYRTDLDEDILGRDKGVARWLSAVEEEGIKDLPTAEQLALAAYQSGDMRAAARWVARAPTSPAVQWVNAKLWLRAGKIDRAAAILKQIVNAFPAPPSEEEARRPMSFEAGLEMGGRLGSENRVTVQHQVLGELGALRLARRDYQQALDALLRADFWMDAAYVAERVLTLDELKRYVAVHWPAVESEVQETQSVQRPTEEQLEESHRKQIRHLLARRLVRNSRGAEAVDYFPKDQRASLRVLLEAMTQANDEAVPKTERAKAWWEAAQMARTNGLSLLATEVGPDWAIHDGQFEEGVALSTRLDTNSVTHASADEAARANRHIPNPQERFHYRYMAAAMGWQAAQLMPNNTDQKARVLCTAGSWLKNRDPRTADIFYKALVRSCRKTAIGSQADVMRWFPVLDAEGNPRPWKAPEPKVEDSVESPAPESEPSQEADPAGEPVRLNSE